MTLIGIKKPDGFIKNKKIEDYEIKLREIRHKIFNSKTSKTKKDLKEKDKKLREMLSEFLIREGWTKVSANKLALWKPFDQNMSSEWFDPVWMFGIIGGFMIWIMLLGKSNLCESIKK